MTTLHEQSRIFQESLSSLYDTYTLYRRHGDFPVF
jgi:hypothetical protein